MTILIGIAGQTGPKYYRLSYGKRPLAGEGALGCSFFGRSASAAGQGGGLSRRKFRNPGTLTNSNPRQESTAKSGVIGF